MSAAVPIRSLNRLMAGLPSADRSRIEKRCDTVDLISGEILCEANQPLRNVYFPLTGFISLVAVVNGRHPLEMGLIGSEGMLGVTLVLGVDAAPQRGVVQAAGTALRMSARQFRKDALGSPALLRRLNRYLYVLMAQLSQTAVCNRFHEIEPRLARCLLMTHDRSQGDRFNFTHESLADLLGVRRSAVTIAAGALQRRRLINYTRGEITVINRMGLEAASCGCYRATIDDYDRLLA